MLLPCCLRLAAQCMPYATLAQEGAPLTPPSHPFTSACAPHPQKGSRWNIRTLLAALFFLVPVGGLAFAFWSYGTLWG